MSKTETVVLKNGGVIKVQKSRWYATIDFDLWRSPFNLTEEGREFFFETLKKYMKPKTRAVYSQTSGYIRFFPLEHLEAFLNELKDLLTDTKYLKRIPSTVKEILEKAEELK